jgi:hypothetical protein
MRPGESHEGSLQTILLSPEKGGFPHHGHPVDLRWRRGKRFTACMECTVHWEGELGLELRGVIRSIGQIKTVRQRSIDLDIFLPPYPKGSAANGLKGECILTACRDGTLGESLPVLGHVVCPRGYTGQEVTDQT